MTKPKKILNDAATSVDEFLEGLLLQYPNTLAKLQNHHVVLSSHISKTKVHLISGGGSGHEPSHAGWIDGNGMLSAAVCGGIFASPSVHSIVAAIRAVANDTGVLLVIKNYTGDRLNFGMAAEKAIQEGVLVEMVVVADDCAMARTKGITGARGLAGTVLVHKIAGAAAAAGKTLKEVAKIAKDVCSLTGTLGVSLDTVTVPGAEKVNDRLNDETIEIGLGIHGEAGLTQSPLKTADELAESMIETIQQYGRTLDDGSIVPFIKPGDDICLLINNLGGTSNFEMGILARSCIKRLEVSTYGVTCSRVLVGQYMTSFEMHGASITIMNVTGRKDLLEFFDAKTTAPAWVNCDVWTGGESRPSSHEVPEKLPNQSVVEFNLPDLEGLSDFASTAKQLATAAAEKLAESEHLLTKYDTIVGDGDCGITMKRGATEVLERINQGTILLEHPVTMFDSLANAVSASMGGTSGILVEIMFRKISSTLSKQGKIGFAEMSIAFQAGVDAVCLYGGASVGSRTMLDALVPAATELVVSNSLKKAAIKARAGADGTADIKVANAGRSNYLSEETLAGTPDPGAIAVAIVLESLAG
jgi:dihydroxyacetone kinase